MRHGLRGTERLIDVFGALPVVADRALADPLVVLTEAGAVQRAPVPSPPSIRDFLAPWAPAASWSWAWFTATTAIPGCAKATS